MTFELRLSNDARALLEEAVGRPVSAKAPELSKVMFRRSLLHLGRRAPQLIRAVAAIPEDREPWQWCPEQAEESHAPMECPIKAILKLADQLTSDTGMWLIQVEDLILAFLVLAGAPLKPAAAWKVEVATEALREEDAGENGKTAPSEKTLEELFPTLSQEKKDEPHSKRSVEDPGGGKVAPECPVLESLAVDLTRMAAEGKLPPVAGRDEEITAVLETLLRLSKRNPLLVGLPGCGKTAIVAGVAQRIAEGRAPKALAGARVMSLQSSDLVAGTKYRGTLQERMKTIIEEASQPGVILFIDEIHTVIGAGTSAKSDEDVANLLKPALADGRIACIGATTDAEVARLSKDGAFERRFRVIPVVELGHDAALAALNSRAVFIAESSGVKMENRAVSLAQELSDRLIRFRVQPDKGIDVLEQAAARAQMRGQESVDPEQVREVVREMIGMPFRASELGRRLHLMAEVIEGLGLMDRNTAGKLADRLQMTMLGMDMRPERPNAVILAVGPRASGEELARIVAEVLLESQELVRIDLPEGRGPAAVGQLLGREGGGWKEAPPAFHLQLTRRPWSVVLVTGAEKAWPEAVDILVGAMERGVLETTANRRIPFADAIFVIVTRGEQTRAPGFSAGGNQAIMAQGEAETQACLKRLDPRLARQVDIACGVTGAAAAPGERWVRLRLLGPIARRWKAEMGVQVKFDGEIACALSDAAGRDGLDLQRLTRLFEETVAGPLAPALAASAVGSTVDVHLVRAQPPAIAWAVGGTANKGDAR